MSRVDESSVWESVVKAAFTDCGIRVATAATFAVMTAVGSSGAANASVNANDSVLTKSAASHVTITAVKQTVVAPRKLIRTARAIIGRP
jgi:hypothetical protein